MRDITDLPGLQNSEVENKKVLLRVDLNVPILGAEVGDKTRIERIVPTVKYLINAGAKTVLISHLGRPNSVDPKLSLAPLADILGEVLKTKVTFLPSIYGESVHTAIDSLPWGSVILLENLRFFRGESTNDQDFAKQLASLADLYVNDAFSCSHRKHASIDAVSKLLPAFAGFNLQEELKQLGCLVNERPVAAIIGGAKASTKIRMLSNLAGKVDFLILGGGLANTFLSALGYNVGSSVFEPNCTEACEVVEVAKRSGCKMILPVDHITASDPACDASNKDNASVTSEDIIFDIGSKTSLLISNILGKCNTIFWNGPMGMFENKNFARGTTNLVKEMVNLNKHANAKTIIGGGDSIFAVKSLGYSEQDFTYVSTGGGALLHFLSVQRHL